ncbi:MAG: Asp-tRNA(Asn)/Glu-tRNA(Gln) amidotransferase subunit GatB [Cytophagales bacterium]|nr:Asp-tRNA(Asn)/Glu-tRNA(Gln) amidotransferase subunit GatB [Cytophagales bacterium]
MTKEEKYQVTIGLEVHTQLITQSKIFNGCSTEFGNLPNTNIDVHTLAHPGTLPRLNKKVIEYAIKLGLACKSHISQYQYFDRKNYFYPDLPKGYQTTQDKTPICKGGYISIKLKDDTYKKISITKIHMEEDAGKSHHHEGESESLVDLNRAGVPLLEVVTDPVMHHADEAVAFMMEIRKLIRYLEIGDGNMEEGSMRCDVNISLAPIGIHQLGKKVEVKNLNSFNFVRKAIEYEIDRQTTILENGENIISETRTFNTVDMKTYSLRTKEDLNDYRYFPEPDLQPFTVTNQYLEEVKQLMPPLPYELFDKFTNIYKLPDYDAGVLTDTKDVALYFDMVCLHTQSYKTASNWVMGPVKSYLNERTLSIKDFPTSPESLASLLALIEDGTVSHTAAAQKIFPAMLESPLKHPKDIANELNLVQQGTDDFILPIINEVLASYPDKVAEYKAGKKGLIGLFVGEVMKKAQGKADPKKTNNLISKLLE